MLKFSSSSKMVELAHFLGLNKNQVGSFDLPAGWTCPSANICLARTDRITGKLTDGKNSRFRCYAASSEAAFTNTRRLRWDNFDVISAVKDTDSITDMLLDLIDNSKIKVLRVHSSGDFFSEPYFLAWLSVAHNRPNISFFGYTKVINLFKYPMPDNFNLVYSYGGKDDHNRTNEPTSFVIRSLSKNMGLPVACQNHPADDYQFITNRQSFCLLLHGTQPARNKVK